MPQPLCANRKLLLCIIHLTFVLFPLVALSQSKLDTLPDNLNQLIPKLMKETGVPGLSVATIQQGEPQWVKSYGLADNIANHPLTASTSLEAASLSKPILAYLTLKMVRIGKISLDKPLDQYLPYPRFGDHPYAKEITARMVLSHQTGLPNWGGKTLDFNFKPGTKFGYSGEGYVYLQKVLEHISGVDLQTLASREVFIPLRMKNSRFTWHESEQFALSKGHDLAGNLEERRIPEANAASSLHTTAEDYALFLAAWLDATNPLFDELQQAFVSAIWMQGNERGGKLLNQPDQRIGWGLGWGVQQTGNTNILWHWGDNRVFRSFTAINPESKNGVVFLTNSQNGLALAKRLVEQVMGDMRNTFAWLHYPQSDFPGWQSAHLGFVAEANKDYSRAITLFKKSLLEAPKNKPIEHRITWLSDHLSFESNTLPLSPKQLELIPGKYGPRRISRDGNQLIYQREGGRAYAMQQVKPNIFVLDTLMGFRIEVVFNQQGRPKKLVGYYIEGGSDESNRTPTIISALPR